MQSTPKRPSPGPLFEAAPARTGSAQRRDRAGNAYLVTVMVMIIVTLLGLSLGAVTQTEMLIGSRERNNQRAFYLAESGLNIAVSQFLLNADTDAMRIEWTLPPAYDFSADGGFEGVTMEAVHRVAPVALTWSNYCQLCAVGAWEAEDTVEMGRFVFTVRSSMRSASGQILAQRRVSSLVDLYPIKAQGQGTGIASQRDEIEFD